MKRRYKALLGVVGLLGLTAVWFVNSGRLEQYVVERLKGEVERSLGAKLEMESMKIELWRGRVSIGGLVLHGKEGAGEEPLFRAKRIQIDAGLQSLSASRVDLRALEVVEPRFHLIHYADGTTNLPGPKKRGGKGALEQIVDWRLGKLSIEKGNFEWNERQIPFALRGDDVVAKMDYLIASRSYQGKLEAGAVGYQQGALPLIEGKASIDFGIDQEKIRIEKAKFESAVGTNLNARGELLHIDGREEPFRAEMELDGIVAVKQVLPFLKLPVEPSGWLSYAGKLLFEAGRGVELHGEAKGKELYYRDATTRLGPLAAKAKMDLLPARMTLSGLKVEGFGGSVDGNFLWDLQEGWSLDGDLSQVELSTVLRQLNMKDVPWSGKIQGPIEARGGRKPLEMEADLEIVSSKGPSPLEGMISLSYFEAGNQLLARSSYLALPHTRLNFAGDLAKGIALEVRSTEFRELLPVLQMVGWKGDSMPVGLQQGSAEVSGQLSGSIQNPRFRGMMAGHGLLVEGKKIDDMKARVTYGEDLAVAEQLELQGEGAEIRGSVRAVLEDGKLTERSLLSGKLEVQVADMSRIGLGEPVVGSGQGSFALRGTWGDPGVDGNWRSAALEVREFRFQQVSAVFSASRREVIVPEWEARLGRQPLRGTLNLKAGGNDWKLGSGKMAIKVEALPLQSIAQFRAQGLNVNAQMTADTQADFTWSPEGVSPSKLDGKLTLANITRFGRPVGNLEFTSRSSGQRASLTATGSIRQLPIKGDATIQFGTKLNTELRLQFPRLDFPTIAQLFSEEVLPTPLPYEGGAEASFYFKGSLSNPEDWNGRLTIPQLQLAPNKEYVAESMPAVADIVLRNEGPIVVELSKGLVAARNVRFVAKNTNLTTSLLYRTDTRGVTGTAKGTINLGILSTLKPDLLASGAAELDASIQGQSDDPQLNGKLSFQNASFYLRDVITGLDKVNGTLLFDKSRATIETLKAQAGGGELQLAGFVGFGKVLSYRLQAQATQVRLRYPEGISTSANASLAITGTTAQSILTGTVSILRSSIGQVDTAQLLSSGISVAESSAQVKNEFLRNLQFDVKIEAAQNVEFSTAFTKDVKGEVALRLRGNPQRPILLGRIAVTQGEVDFFGGRYQISRGEVNFTNPLRIEPVIGLDLETRVRGVAISMNFSGPASKLNMTYRSDPPLQSNEILALLTVGRNPGSTSAVAQGPVGQTQGMFGNDSSVILGAAVTAGINGRLQRFFGISRVRLDPQLTGIDNVPQARLTLEQQVSRDVTLTYITNLNRTQQQIVRIDWDISKAWTVVAVRDENGIFGLDLFFRKRIK
jgi:translocation and assembly module TamB